MAQASLQTRFADSPLLRYGLPAVSCLLATVFSVLAVKPVDFHEFVNAIKELGVFWAIINEPPPGSVRK